MASLVVGDTVEVDNKHSQFHKKKGRIVEASDHTPIGCRVVFPGNLDKVWFHKTELKKVSPK